jgi:hypothetical protein
MKKTQTDSPVVDPDKHRGKTTATLSTDIGRHIRDGQALVNNYLTYAAGYASLSVAHAEALLIDTFPLGAMVGRRVIAVLPLSSHTPEQLAGKIQAVKQSSSATITAAFVCRHTMSVYIFGEDK